MTTNMKQSWHLIFVIALLIGSGCASKSKKAEKERISTKSSLTAGDRILYENDTDMILSLDNDSMVVRRNLIDGTNDTILTTPLDLRMSILSSPEHILVVRREALGNDIELLSYDIESYRLNSAIVNGLGYMPYFPGQRIDMAVVKEDNGSLYEASYGICFDLTESDFVDYGHKIGVTLQKDADGAIYWWYCEACGKSVTSHSEPPRGGCTFGGHRGASGLFGPFHVWKRENRAN